MRLPADGHGARRLFESVARALAMLALLLILFEVTRPADAAPPRRASDADVERTLRAATVEGGDRPVHLHFTRVPQPSVRDWAAALRRAGTPLHWMAEGLAPMAASLEPVVDPRGGHELHVWRASEEPLVIRDAAGELIRLDADAGMAVVSSPSVRADVAVDAPRQQATVPATDSVRAGAVLVLGRAGWEARFLLRALDEIGWAGHARLSVAPGVWVEQGRVGAIDTARYAAVVVLDSSAAPLAGALSRYMQAGGGLVIAGEGATIAALSSIAPGGGSRRLVATTADLPEGAPLNGLPLRAVTSLRADAARLASRGGATSMAARRVGAGRVMHMGYEDSWRLRMETGSQGPEVHRELWGRVISAVAYALPAAGSRTDANPVPFAALVASLGEPGAATAEHGRRWSVPVLPLVIAAMLLLLSEWVSRRLRGRA